LSPQPRRRDYPNDVPKYPEHEFDQRVCSDHATSCGRKRTSDRKRGTRHLPQGLRPEATSSGPCDANLPTKQHPGILVPPSSASQIQAVKPRTRLNSRRAVEAATTIVLDFVRGQSASATVPTLVEDDLSPSFPRESCCAYRALSMFSRKTHAQARNDLFSPLRTTASLRSSPGVETRRALASPRPSLRVALIHDDAGPLWLRYSIHQMLLATRFEYRPSCFTGLANSSSTSCLNCARKRLQSDFRNRMFYHHRKWGIFFAHPKIHRLTENHAINAAASRTRMVLQREGSWDDFLAQMIHGNSLLVHLLWHVATTLRGLWES